MNYESIKTNKAFTLIELLVVIAIIGILTSVIMVNLNDAKAKSRDAKRIADVETIRLALELYRDRCRGQYPVAIDSEPYIHLSANNGCPPNVTLQTFLRIVPTYPVGVSGESHYRYIAAYDGSEFYLGAVLERFNQALIDDLDGCVGLSELPAPACDGPGGDWHGYQNGGFYAGMAGSDDRIYTVGPN